MHYNAKNLKKNIKIPLIKNFNVDHPSKSNLIKNKFNLTMIEKYGVKNALENIKIKEKMFLKQLNENNGFYFFQTDDFKEKSKKSMIDKYNVENFNNREKSKRTCLRKIWRRIFFTKCRNTK